MAEPNQQEASRVRQDQLETEIEILKNQLRLMVDALDTQKNQIQALTLSGARTATEQEPGRAHLEKGESSRAQELGRARVENGEPSRAQDMEPFEDMDDYLMKKKGDSNPKDNKRDEKIEELAARLDKMARETGGRPASLDIDDLLMTEELPLNFKIPDFTKFDGSGDPTMHIRQYAFTMSTTGLSRSQILKMFVLSLKDAALVWYHDQEKWVREDWKTLIDQFIEQYGYNTHIETTPWDLETTKQKQGESFSDYVARWRAKAAKMRHRPVIRDQIRILIRGAIPTISEKMQYTVVRGFEDLMELGLQIEEAEAENRKHYPRPMKGSNQSWNGNGSSNSRSSDVNAIRKFSQFDKPMKD